MFKSKYKALTVVVYSVILLSLLVGCAEYRVINRQTDYHESISDLEKYVLEDMGEYISFGEPIFDEDYKTFCCSIYFVTDYTKDSSQINEYSLLQVMEDTRLKINEYLESNPDSTLLEYSMCFEFVIAPDRSPISDVTYLTIGEVRNELTATENECRILSESICRVYYYNELDRDSVDSVTCEGIKECRLTQLDEEDVLYIIDNMPDLECVEVSKSLARNIEQTCPDLVVIGI